MCHILHISVEMKQFLVTVSDQCCVGLCAVCAVCAYVCAVCANVCAKACSGAIACLDRNSSKRRSEFLNQRHLTAQIHLLIKS